MRAANEVIVQVKTNQQALLRCLDHVVATQRPVAVETSRQRGRNRQEDRRITVYAAGSALERTPWSPLITAIVRVERDTLLRSRRDRAMDETPGDLALRPRP